MKKRQKGIAILLAVCFLCALVPVSVFAAWEHGDKGNADFTKILVGKDGKEYYINENVRTVFYSNSGKKTVKAGNGRTKVRWRYLKISDVTAKDSKYGYCAEFGASFSDQANYKAIDSTKGKNLFKGLPSDARSIIAATLCYGRDGKRKVPVSKANDADYYFATQIIIWEAQQGLRTITKKNGSVSGTKLAEAHGMKAQHMQSFLKGRPAQRCYNWLVDKVNDHLKTYSFTGNTVADATTHLMKYDKNSRKWAVTLKDANKKKNGIVPSDSRIKVTKSSYQYTFESAVPFENGVTLSVSNKLTGGSNAGKLLVWNCTTNTDYQAMITGSLDLTTMYMKFKTESANEVIVEKRDEETGKRITAAPATYEITDSSGKTIAKELRTNSNGQVALSEKLGNGTYGLKEVEAPEGYKLKKEIQKFTINNGPVTVEQKDAPQKGIIKLQKNGERFVPEDGEMKPSSAPLEGVVFEIFAAEDIVTGDGTVRLKKGQSAGIMTTDSEGKTNSRELYLGNYNIVEKEAPEGYLPSTEAISAELHYAGQNVELAVTEITVSNRQKSGTIQIEKTDVSTGQPLPNTGIEILDKDKKVILQTRTDSEGNVVFQNLPTGNYYFREFDAPKGYLIDDSPYPFEIKDDGEILKCEMTNKKVPQEVSPMPENGPRPKQDHSPQTGDSFAIWVAASLLFLSAGMIFIVIRRRRRY